MSYRCVLNSCAAYPTRSIGRVLEASDGGEALHSPSCNRPTCEPCTAPARRGHAGLHRALGLARRSADDGVARAAAQSVQHASSAGGRAALLCCGRGGRPLLQPEHRSA